MNMVLKNSNVQLTKFCDLGHFSAFHLSVLTVGAAMISTIEGYTDSMN